ncbi:MAG: undecaprenyl-diphosphate phosphatase [Collinsella sp.]
MDIIELLKSAFLGLVEGITEWLPISSTGHMILVDEFVHLNVTEEFWNMFLVVIQLGAILAVCVLFLRDLLPFGFGKTRVERRNTWSLWGKIVLGCIPAAVIGIPLDDFMEEHLYSATVVAAALIVYGVAFIVIENWRASKLAARVAPRACPRRGPRGAHFAVPPRRSSPPRTATSAPSPRSTTSIGRRPSASAASRCSP